jgi:hypothetical protein
MAKRIVLVFLWLISILGTAGLTAKLMNSPTWVWETKPWVRRIKHWPEPVVALAGDMPIYQSDLQNAFNSLPSRVQDNERKVMASKALLSMTVIPFMWRDAARSYDVFQSTYQSVQMENMKNTILKTLLDGQLFAGSAGPTEAQIQSFIAQNPDIFMKRTIHYREDLYSGSVVDKSSQHKLISSRRGSFVYPGMLNPSSLSLLLPLSPGQSTALVPCGTRLCRYTKEGKDDVKQFDDTLAKQTAKYQILANKEADWLTHYRKSHPIQIKRQDLIDAILR